MAKLDNMSYDERLILAQNVEKYGKEKTRFDMVDNITGEYDNTVSYFSYLYEEDSIVTKYIIFKNKGKIINIYSI